LFGPAAWLSLVGAAAALVVVAASLEDALSVADSSVLVSEPQPARLNPSATVATAMTPALIVLLIRSPFKVSP
jgi:hypothetical protein